MQEVSIKCNPYILETDITFDGVEPEGNSWFHEMRNRRLQEWVDDLPRMLVEEKNNLEFHIKFHGTSSDYEDIQDSMDYAVKTIPGFIYSIEHTPAKEVDDKVKKIRNVYNKIQSIKDKKDFKDLQGLVHPQIVNAFDATLNNKFKVFVVAPMSAGKSTLINSMLGRKLMPSKQEACTALITHIIDKDSEEEDAPFRAEAYDALSGGNRLETIERLRLEDMERLYGREDVKRIEANGDIPFVSSDEISLELIDTPGPNNTRTNAHREVQQQMMDTNAMPLIIYVMTPQFATKDDRETLEKVAKAMGVGGKQARDRFLFVVNKMDDLKKDDGNPQDLLKKVREYLVDFGIPAPNIFPLAAFPAMNIRLLDAQELDDEDEIDELKSKIRKLNRSTKYHFEKLAPLPRRIQAEIDRQLENEKDSWKGDENENPHTALIHTGVPSLEAAISQYVDKYARTDKIKTLVHTFINKLENLETVSKLKNAIATNAEARKNIGKKMAEVREKMSNTANVKSFKERVDQVVKTVVSLAWEGIDKRYGQFNAQINNMYAGRSEEKIECSDVDAVVNDMQQSAKDLQIKFKKELEELIENVLVSTGKQLVKEYCNRLTKISKDTSNSSPDIKFSPLSLMGFALDEQTMSRAAIDSLAKKESVLVGQEYVENTDKAWWKPWTWTQEEGYWRKTFKTHHYILIGELSQKFFQPIQVSIRENAQKAKSFAHMQSQEISNYFKELFDELDNIVKDQLDDLEQLTKEKNISEEELKILQSNLQWIEGIQSEINQIIEI